MYARTNKCYNERGSRTNYVRSSVPHCTCVVAINMLLPLMWPSSWWFLGEKEHNCNSNVSESLHSIKNHIMPPWRCPREWPKHVCLPQYNKSSPKKLKCVCWSLVYCTQVHSLVYCTQVHSFSALDMGLILGDFLTYTNRRSKLKQLCYRNASTLQDSWCRPTTDSFS
jgi:hypothetical protein